MTTYPESELIDFIKSQPDEREINMHQAVWLEGQTDCGCVLVHFGQMKGLKAVAAGFHRLDNEHEVSTNLIHKFSLNNITNYAQAKALL